MDKELADRRRASLLENKNKSEETHDKTFTFITAGALAVSISFISNVVHLHQACFLFLLIISWGLLTLSLIINLLGHKLTAEFSHKALIKFDQSLDVDMKIEKASDTYNKRLKAWDWISIIFSLSAIILLVTFCSINTYNMPKENEPIKVPQVHSEPLEKKGHPIYYPRDTTPIPQTAPPPLPQKKE